MTTEHKERLFLAGLKLKIKTTNTNGQSAIDCGNLWQRFEKEKIADKIPAKLSNDIFAVYYNYDIDDSTPFCYFIGCQVSDLTAIPSGFDSLEIPPSLYNKITAKGKMTGCITNAWETIWNSKLSRTYQYDFEVFDERSQNWDNAEVDIYVSIAGS